jgi:hypothetical protein
MGHVPAENGRTPREAPPSGKSAEAQSSTGWPLPMTTMPPSETV